MHTLFLLTTTFTVLIMAIGVMAQKSDTDSCGTYDGKSVLCTAAGCTYCSTSGSGSGFACRKTQDACPSCKGAWNSKSDCLDHRDPSNSGKSCSWCSFHGDDSGCCGPHDMVCTAGVCTTDDSVKFGTGVLIGICAGSIAGVLLLILLCYYCCCRKANADKVVVVEQHHHHDQSTPPPSHV